MFLYVRPIVSEIPVIKFVCHGFLSLVRPLTNLNVKVVEERGEMKIE